MMRELLERLEGLDEAAEGDLDAELADLLGGMLPMPAKPREVARPSRRGLHQWRDEPLHERPRLARPVKYTVERGTAGRPGVIVRAAPAGLASDSRARATRVKRPNHIECQAEVAQLMDDGFGPWRVSPRTGDYGEDVVIYELVHSVNAPQLQGTTSKVGKQMYLKLIAAIRKMHPKGFFFINNACGEGSTSDLAVRLWASLARRYPSATKGRGTVVYIGPRRRRT